MEIIESGLDTILGGENCSCVCSKLTAGSQSSKTSAFDEGDCCGCGCSCLTVDTFVSNVANQTIVKKSARLDITIF